MRLKKRVLLRVAVVMLVVYLIFAVVTFIFMHQTPETVARFMSSFPFPVLAILPGKTMWTMARAGDLQPGDPAPDFELSRQDGNGTVRLSELRGKRPVVLVFGSYT